MIEAIVGGALVALLAGGVFAIYRLGGSGTRQKQAEREAKGAQKQARRLAKRRRRGRGLLRKLRDPNAD